MSHQVYARFQFSAKTTQLGPISTRHSSNYHFFFFFSLLLAITSLSLTSSLQFIIFFYGIEQSANNAAQCNTISSMSQLEFFSFFQFFFLLWCLVLATWYIVAIRITNKYDTCLAGKLANVKEILSVWLNSLSGFYFTLR